MRFHLYQAYELAPKKEPKQKRSKATFDSIVEACELILPKYGYRGTTTNHIAESAGVGIASLYQYFPGKDAIIRQVADKLSQRFLSEAIRNAPSISNAKKQHIVKNWLDFFILTLKQEQQLVKIFMYEVPYTNQLAQEFELTDKLVKLCSVIAGNTRAEVKLSENKASLYLLVNMTTSSIFQIITDPAKGVKEEEMVEHLCEHINRWINP